MIRALAPRMPRGYSWAWLSIVLIGVLASAVAAQPKEPKEPKEKGSSTKKANAPEPSKTKSAEKAAEKKAAEKKAEDEPAAEPETKTPLLEVFEDPNAAAANENKFTPLPSVTFNPRQIKEVRAMAGSGTPDVDLIQNM